MFSRVVALTALTLPLLAVATPTGTPPATPASQCNTGPVQCCDSVQTVSDLHLLNLLLPLNVIIFLGRF